MMKRSIAALVLTVALGGTALAADSPVRVRGTVSAFDGTTISVTTAGGAVAKLSLAPASTVSLIVKADLKDVAAGSYVGAAALPQPDGTLRAQALSIFPPGRKPPGGYRPWDLSPGSTMTNANVTTIGSTKVDNVDARVLTLQYDGGEKQLVVPPATPIVTYVPGDLTAVKPGAHVIIFATKHDDDTLTAGSINVGKDGLIPPM